jgi:predicted dehydrogenase
MDRRQFIKAVSAAGLGMALGTTGIHAQMARARKRYAIVGTGARHAMYRDAILGQYKQYAQLVGLCDLNPGRAELSRRICKEAGEDVPTFRHTDFVQMIQQTKPDVVIVTTVDATHDQYIVAALENGCDVITEKPLTTTAQKCQRILDARKRTGRKVRVTFNYRYSPPRTQVKEILSSGQIGQVLSVDFHWLLNTHHGADYFRRWHSNKASSGGLMVHKASHHFDLVNWWLSAIPVSVFATGKRDFYSPDMARRMGLSGPHERCSTCPEKDRCGFFFDLSASPNLKALYLDQEHHDGYFRDQCVFRPEIDIEDIMNVIVQYDNGATLSYTLNAFNAWEGYMIAFNGTKGRLEHSIVEQIYVSGTQTIQGGIASGGVSTRIIPLRGPAQEIEPWAGVGSHGGGDKLLLDDIFLPEPPVDKYLRAADERGGAWAALVGIAANICFKTGQPVRLQDLVHGLGRPDYPAMPSKDEPVPMPTRSNMG